MISINLYRSAADLFAGDSVVSLQEGTTKGDLLSMPLHALTTVPLIKKLPSLVLQSWYADDASASRQIHKLHLWWNDLADIGPQYGYYAKPWKTWLITKHIHYDRARVVFDDTQINITIKGRPQYTWEHPYALQPTYNSLFPAKLRLGVKKS